MGEMCSDTFAGRCPGGFPSSPPRDWEAALKEAFNELQTQYREVSELSSSIFGHHRALWRLTLPRVQVRLAWLKNVRPFKPGTCQWCHIAPPGRLLKCGGCKDAYYCSLDCQKSAWKVSCIVLFGVPATSPPQCNLELLKRPHC